MVHYHAAFFLGLPHPHFGRLPDGALGFFPLVVLLDFVTVGGSLFAGFVTLFFATKGSSSASHFLVCILVMGGVGCEDPPLAFSTAGGTG